MVKEKSGGGVGGTARTPEIASQFKVSIVKIHSSLQLMTLFAVDVSGEENCFPFALCVDDPVNHISVFCRKIKAMPVKNRLFFQRNTKELLGRIYFFGMLQQERPSKQTPRWDNGSSDKIPFFFSPNNG